MLSDYITPESQYLETRNIMDRVQRIAPFLLYDQDPYLVLGEDGHLYYLLDAYTVTDKYPYSQAVGEAGSFNYMRNSVKIVINAYSGEVDFYVFDQEDPIIKVYSKIYPTLFKSSADFPQDLRAHIRYPEDFFTIQSLMIRDYHMMNPTVFFTREDRWEFGREVYWGELQVQEPFYSIIRLPGEEKEEFILMRVFSPARKQNMIAWLAARSDGDNYGKLLLYKFPKGVQIPGTAQVESLIDQDSEISSQLTLWGQGGSRVLRGNLLVYPIAGSLLYVEPLYIEAEQNKYPQLKKVFVYYKDTIVMEDTLEQALVSIFGGDVGKDALSSPEEHTEAESGIIVHEDTFQELFMRLVDLHREGREKIKAGDWAGYGRIQKEIDSLIGKRWDDEDK
ncbi:MAG TPA: COG1615 family transporter [Clostridia bacterium]|nr:COG1615 family transporter [Clostridia bacterium]